MKSNKSEMSSRIKLAITLTIAFVVSVNTVINIQQTDLINSVRGNMFYTILAIIGLLIFSGLLSEFIVKAVVLYLQRKKGEYHGWWYYCFLFDKDQSGEINCEKPICFRKGKKEKLLVVGYFQIHQDCFETKLINESGHSHTFESGTKALVSRLDWRLRGFDIRNNEIIIIYRARIPNELDYQGIYDLYQPVPHVLIKTNSNIRIRSYTGLIQDLKIENKIIETEIYAQQLSTENITDANHIKNLIEQNIDRIINYYKQKGYQLVTN